MALLPLAQFFARYGTNDACLDALREARWPSEVYEDRIPCKKCGAPTRHHLIATRRCYSCQTCGTQVRPTTATMFERSRIALTDWFYVLYLFARLSEPPSARQVAQEIGVSYPTALRMCRRIQERADEAQALADVLFEVAEVTE
ncbi:MAG: IS1595 family transposase [Bacteroidota bacterium]